MRERTASQVVSPVIRKTVARRGRRWVAALAAVTSATALVVGGGLSTTSVAAPGSRVVAARAASARPPLSSLLLTGLSATGRSVTGSAVPTVRLDGLSAPSGSTAAAAGRRVIPVGKNPQAVALDSATHTLYEANGESNTISVIDTRTCNARRTSGCRRTPSTVKVGASPTGVAVDQATDTVYVADSGATTVSVIDGATCNAGDHTGCGQVAHTIQVGTGPVALDVDQATDTVYVTDLGGTSNDPGTGTTLAVINGATCNGRVTTGCGQAPGTVTIGEGPAGVIVDQRAGTVYAGSIAPNESQTIAIIDAATCNARVTSGCGHPHLFRDGVGSTEENVGFAIDARAHTLYATNFPDDAVSMIDTTTCRAADTSGCGHHRDVAVGGGPNGLAGDTATRTLYVLNNYDDSVSVLDTATCNARRSAGCRTQPRRAIRTGLGPNPLVADPGTDTIYVPNGDATTVSVLDGATCNATHGSGCTPYPPTVNLGLSSAPFGFALDPATHTVFVADSGTTQAGTAVSVINANTCRAGRTTGCDHSPPTTTVGTNPNEAAFDPATHTVYVSNYISNTVSVIDSATCNALHPVGCRRRTATIKVPGGPFGIAVDVATDTVYVTGVNNGTLSIIIGATCNANHHGGCEQRPRQIPVGANARGVAVNPATHTVYVTAFGTFGGTPLHTMSVFDAATCNARVASGCAHPQRVGVGRTPWGIALDVATDTVYVVDDNSFSGPGSVRVIDGALCNASHHRPCGRTARTIAVGRYPFVPAVDQATGWLYVPNQGDATVSVIDGAACNAVDHAGCGKKAGTVFVDGFPLEALVDDATRTVYISQDLDGTVSVLPALR